MSVFHFLEIMLIKRAVLVDTFVDAEKLPVLFRDKGMAAVGTEETDGSGDIFPAGESLSTDLTLILAVAAIIIIDVMMRSATERADDVFRDGSVGSSLNRSDRFVVFPLIVFEKELPVLSEESLDDRKPVHFEFLIFGGMEIVISPLF